ncbi:MAG: hypothetical protein ACRDRU_24135 [Pseudonocardiaceae bacterium]
MDCYAATLNDLTDLIRDGGLTFPREVVDDLQNCAKEETLDTWIKAVATDRTITAVPYSNVQWVLGQCPSLCDPDAMSDSPTEVAAFGRAIDKNGDEFHIVTEDWTEKPTRMSLAAACEIMSCVTEDVREFLTCVGLENHLRPPTTGHS